MEVTVKGLNIKIKKYICLAIIFIFNCLPIKKNKVFFYSYYGSQYGCSPKYISEHIIKHYPNGHFDLVWAFNDLASKNHLTGIRKVKTMSLKYFYEFCTAKVVITNFRTTDFYVKRKGQYYIQTWHSSLRLKQIEKDAVDSLPSHYVEMAKKDSVKCDLLLSGCEYSTNIFERAFWYKGSIFKHGTPRNDVLFENNDKRRQEILEKLNVPSEYKVVLYAPTFRKGENLSVYDLDYSEIIKSLKERFGGEWVFLVKLHPHLLTKSTELTNDPDVIDVTSYDDIQELLSISNFLISDYSSLMFDFAITQRPCFLYVPDLEEYTSNDRNLYFEIKDLPFIAAKNNKELFRKIQDFNEMEYSQKLNEFHKKIGTYECGTASQNLVKHIDMICYGRVGGVVNEAA